MPRIVDRGGLLRRDDFASRVSRAAAHGRRRRCRTCWARRAGSSIPGVVWALVRTVGLYPAGSVMLTAVGPRGAERQPEPRTTCGRPFCRVLLRPDLSMPGPGSPEVWDPMPDDEQVARTLDPEEFPVDTNALLAA